MALSLKPQHLKRYRDIARLFLKYGRGDLLKNSGLDDLVLEEQASAEVKAAAAAQGGGLATAIHEQPGELLRKQHELDRARAGGEPAQTNGAETRTEPASPRDLGDQLAHDLEAMGPTFVKVGQFLSTRADLLPGAYIEALARLQDHVQPFPFDEVERIVSEELGVRLSKAFAVFEDIPIAAASLGQVHRAELRSGQTVAVKVQRPNIPEQVLEDLEVLEQIAEFMEKHTEFGKRQGLTGMLSEFRKSLLKELDYRQEARNLSTLAENLAEYDRIMVPLPVEDYVTSRVLTMDFVRGRKVTALGPLLKLEIDGAPLAEQLCKAYLQQILVDGFFHADPHPGNIFVTDDGKLALIDLGMVAQIAPALQEDLLKLVLAISEGRGDDAAAIVVKVGVPLGDANPGLVKRQVGEMVLQFQGMRIKDIALGRLLFDAARVATDSGYRMPRELTMLSKTLLNVDEVARRLDPEFDPNAAIRRSAADIMRQRMVKSLAPGKLFAGLLEMKEFAEKLPRRLNELMDAIAENRVRVKVDTINEVLLMEGLQKIANRITLGLIIAAMIVGAAMLMRIETSFRLFGYPGLAILLFLGAAAGGMTLASNILLHDMRAEKARLRALQKQAPREGSAHSR